MQLPTVREVAQRGGNVRVGLEDNIYLRKGVKATNEALVEEAKRILAELDIGHLHLLKQEKNLILEILMVKETNNEIRSCWNRCNW